MADVVTSSTQPALGAIRLAWWREALERLDHAAAPAEPRLQAATSELQSRGIPGKRLAMIEDGYAALLDEAPDSERVGAGGSALFAIAAELLGGADEHVREAGRLHALARAARRGAMALPAGVGWESLEGHRFERRLRPLTGLARLAVRDFRHAPNLEPEASPARAVALLSHRLFGTVA